MSTEGKPSLDTGQAVSRSAGQLSGALVVDKPSGPTSHDVVIKVRRILKTRVGHTGTLDPLASGVLPLLIGKATRLAQFFQIHDKEYVAQIRFGKTTTTYDREGAIVETKPVPSISADRVQEVLSEFRGTLQQFPPLYSAVKVQGRKLYDVARKTLPGDRPQMEVPGRTVTIYKLELLDQAPDLWTIHIHCSSGTYVRSLAHDVGRVVGCGAYLDDLRRTRSGCFDLSRTVGLEQLAEHWQESFSPLEELLPELPRLDLMDAQAQRVRHGATIPLSAGPLDGFCRLFHDGKLIAVGKIEGEFVQPHIVLEPA